MSRTYSTDSAAQTIRLGRKFGALLKKGDVVALSGPLGSGKTTITKGIAEALGLKRGEEVSSPTFVVIHEYQGRERLYHLDWYRLDRVVGADASLAEECFASPAVTLVEWPERGSELFPKDYFQIRLKHLKNGRRSIVITARGKARDRLKKMGTR